MEKQKLKNELMKFAEYCKKQGGSSWYNIPEFGIDNYINTKLFRKQKLERILNEKQK